MREIKCDMVNEMIQSWSKLNSNEAKMAISDQINADKDAQSPTDLIQEERFSWDVISNNMQRQFTMMPHSKSQMANKPNKKNVNRFNSSSIIETPRESSQAKNIAGKRTTIVPAKKIMPHSKS